MRTTRALSSIVAAVVLAGSLLAAAVPPPEPIDAFGSASVVVDCNSLQGDWFRNAAVSTTLQNLTPGTVYSLVVRGGSGTPSGSGGTTYPYSSTHAVTADSQGAATITEAASAEFTAGGLYFATLSLGGNEVAHHWITSSSCTADAPAANLSLTLDCPTRYVAAGAIYSRNTHLTGTISGLRTGVVYTLQTTPDLVYSVPLRADSSGLAHVDATTGWPLVQAGLVTSWNLWTYSQGKPVATGSLRLTVSCPALIPAPRTKVTHDYDISGDGFADLLSIDWAGRLRYYPNNSHSNPGHVPFLGNYIVGTGWGGLTNVSAGDVNGDGLADLVGADQRGILYLYTNSIKSNPKAPFARVSTIGSGWQSTPYFILGDVTGDGYADIIAYRGDGSRWLYQNRFKTDPLHRPFSSAVRIGAEQIWSFVGAAGDLNGDGYADLIDGPEGTAIYPNLTPDGGRNNPFADSSVVGVNAPISDRPSAGYALGDWEGRGYDSVISANPNNNGDLVYIKDPFPTTGGPPTATVISTGWQVIYRIIP